MTDVFDRATEVEQLQRDLAIRSQRREANERERARKAAAILPASECTDCGERIPQARREAESACTRCIKCERDTEARRKLTHR